ncbi:MAG: hypothetical protein CXR31_12115 [Geobacter sp.]|nr:MAG: hypothetical protein CXR31_12115 [Geobacter sp.]
MKFLKAALLMALVVAIFCQAGCNKNESRLVGKWRNQSLPEIVEFKNDKTGTFIVKDGSPLSFTWKIVKGDNVQLDIPYQGKVRSLTGSVDKNVFVLNGQGEQAVYMKMEGPNK